MKSIIYRQTIYGLCSDEREEVFMNFRKAAAAITAIALLAGTVNGIPLSGDRSTDEKKVSAAETNNEELYSFNYDLFSDHAVITGVDVKTNRGLRINSIPDSFEGVPVTEIGDNAFAEIPDIVTFGDLVIPDSVRKIGADAFRRTGITDLTLPEGLEEIGDKAFFCNSIDKLNIPSSVKIIGEAAFGKNWIETINVNSENKNFIIRDNIIYTEDMTRLVMYSSAKLSYGGIIAEKYIVPETVKKIDSYAFSEHVEREHFYYDNVYPTIKEIILPEGIEEIGEYAFRGIDILKVNIPSSVEKIGVGAFYNTIDELSVDEGNKNFILSHGILYDLNEKRLLFGLDSKIDVLTVDFSVPVSEEIVSVDPWAFYSCEKVSHVDLPDGVKSIGEHAFDKTKITQAILPDGLEYIGASAFENCEKLEKVYIPSSVSAIGAAAFSNCISLKNITLPEKLEKLEYMLFFNTGLTEITIPENVSIVERDVFLRCDSLESVYIHLDQHDIFKDYNVSIPYTAKIKYLDKNVICVDGVFFSSDMKTLIKRVSGSDNNIYTVPSTVETIADGAFSGCGSLEKIVLPDGLKKIGVEAFGRSGLISITIPDSVESIGDHAFSECDELEEIIFPEKISFLGEGVLEGCFELSSVILPSGISRIPSGFFTDCYRMESLAIPDTVKELNEGDLPERLTDLFLPDSVSDESLKVLSGTNIKRICGGTVAKNAAAVAGAEYIPETVRFAADANFDGKIDILDLILLKNYLLTEEADILADTNLDHEVNSADLVLMHKVLNGCDNDAKRGYRDIEVMKYEMDDSDDYNFGLYTDEAICFTDNDKLNEYIKRYVKDNSEFEEFLNTQVAKRLEDSVVYMFIADVQTGTYPVLKLDRLGMNSSEIRAELEKNIYYFSQLGAGRIIYTVAVPKEMFSYQNMIIETTQDYYDVPAKPVIYLYPEEETEINVKLCLSSKCKLTYSYPQYPGEDGWTVTAKPDSTIYDSNGREYSYLFWEAENRHRWDMSEGFVVKGSDTVSFLHEKLEYLGLTPKEYNEFIVYWMPKMVDNPYNLITFQTNDYEAMAKLEITPEPDSIQRVFMTFKALDDYTEVKEQKLEPFERYGYSVIEWGGAEVTED